MRDYLALFHQLLVTKIAGHLGKYQGARVTMGLARVAEDTEIVITTVERRHQSAADAEQRFRGLPRAPPRQRSRTAGGDAATDRPGTIAKRC
jgi:hypothetical protein